MRHENDVYKYLLNNCKGLDSVYEDYIVQLVGEYGLNILKEKNLIETCGVVYGRQLYVIVEEK